jgi:hypothetical protein
LPVSGLVNPLIPAGAQHTVNAKILEAKNRPYQVSCNIHPWMKAWVLVCDHPYFAVTDKDGTFQIKNAPAGTFRLMIWKDDHGWLGGVKGRNGMEVAIKAGGVTDVGQLKIKPDPEDKK